MQNQYLIQHSRNIKFTLSRPGKRYLRDEFWVKPIDLEQLITAIRKCTFSWECGGSCNPATRRLVMSEGLRSGAPAGAGFTLTGRPH